MTNLASNDKVNEHANKVLRQNLDINYNIIPSRRSERICSEMVVMKRYFFVSVPRRKETYLRCDKHSNIA